MFSSVSARVFLAVPLSNAERGGLLLLLLLAQFARNAGLHRISKGGLVGWLRCARAARWRRRGFGVLRALPELRGVRHACACKPARVLHRRLTTSTR